MDLGGPQTVKVLSPEILYLLECAQVLCFTEGNTLRCDTRRVAWGHPGSKAGSRLTLEAAAGEWSTLAGPKWSRALAGKRGEEWSTGISFRFLAAVG